MNDPRGFNIKVVDINELILRYEVQGFIDTKHSYNYNGKSTLKYKRSIFSLIQDLRLKVQLKVQN